MAKILLVEDEVNIASFIERGLQEFGHTVSVAYNGADGWQLAQDEPFDLLVLDIIMPKMNGLDLCRQYRQLYGYDSPVIMLTALGTTDDIVKGLYAGADDYLVKPWKRVSPLCCAGTRRKELRSLFVVTLSSIAIPGVPVVVTVKWN